MPTMSLPPTSEQTRVTSAYAVPPMNATSIAPPMPTIDFGRPLANVVMSPVFGSTREILPAAPSVTFSAPPGPTVLPEPPSRPVSSWVALGSADGGAALAADGVIIPIRATANNNSFRWGPIRPSLIYSVCSLRAAEANLLDLHRRPPYRTREQLADYAIKLTKPDYDRRSGLVKARTSLCLIRHFPNGRGGS